MQGEDTQMLSHRMELPYKLLFNLEYPSYRAYNMPNIWDNGRLTMFLRTWKMEDSSRPTEPLVDQVLHSDRAICACGIHPVEECQRHMGYSI